MRWPVPKELIKQYPADAAAYNNLALCATHLRNFKDSLEARVAARKLLPKRSVYSFNLAIDSTYAGKFATGESEATVARELGSPLGPVALAFAHVALNRLQEARSTLEDLAKGTGTLASRGQAGLAELAAFQGRYADAVRLFEDGAKRIWQPRIRNAPLTSSRVSRMVRVGSRSEGRCASGRAAGTRAKPLAKIQFLSGRMFAETGDLPRARKAMEALASQLQDEPVAMARVLEGNIALAEGKLRDAISGVRGRERDRRHLDRAFRSRTGLPRGGPADAGRIPSSTAASPVAAKRCRCSWTTSRRSAMCRLRTLSGPRQRGTQDREVR